MERIESNSDWTLMCPRDCPGLDVSYGHEFRALYERYEYEGKGRKVVKAQQLWYLIVEAQIETGMPMMLYKDAANRESNQQNLGVIQSSTLNGECMQVSKSDEISATNMAYLVLPKFVSTAQTPKDTKDCAKDRFFDFQKLSSCTRQLVDNLNRLIDNSGFCLDEVKRTVYRDRPISIGVQGLADTFAALRLPFESEAARELNREIFERIYFSALQRSCELAQKHGHYESFPGSPLSQGQLHFNRSYSNKHTQMRKSTQILSSPWDELIKKIKEYGTRNSVLVALGPTNLTSQVLTTSPGVDAYKSVTVKGKLSSGCQFSVINSYLIDELKANDCWNDQVKNDILKGNGSLEKVPDVPEHIKKIYKTAWEIPQKVLIDMAADRAPFIDQSQSLTIRIKDADYAKVSSMHFYGWRKGLKTGMTKLETRNAP